MTVTPVVFGRLRCTCRLCRRSVDALSGGDRSAGCALRGRRSGGRALHRGRRRFRRLRRPLVTRRTCATRRLPAAWVGLSRLDPEALLESDCASAAARRDSVAVGDGRAGAAVSDRSAPTCRCATRGLTSRRGARTRGSDGRGVVAGLLRRYACPAAARLAALPRTGTVQCGIRWTRTGQAAGQG